jgi:hypothetical protein
MLQVEPYTFQVRLSDAHYRKEQTGKNTVKFSGKITFAILYIISLNIYFICDKETKSAILRI